MFDHNIFQENLVGVDFCEKMVAETNPGVLEQANSTEAPHAAEHGYRTIGDIMRSLNPLEGEFYREALQVSPVHPGDVLPDGGAPRAPVHALPGRRRHGRDRAAVHRLPDPADALRRVHEAGRARCTTTCSTSSTRRCPGYEEVGRRRVLLGCWGSFNNPEYCDFTYRNMADWGRKMFVTPGVVVDGKLVTNSLVDINLGIRILLGHSFYEDWEDQEMFVTQGRARQPGRPPSPVEPAHHSPPGQARLRRQVQLDDVAALVRRQGPPAARHRRRPDRAAVVDRAGRPGRHRLREVHRAQRADQPAPHGLQARGHLRVEDPGRQEGPAAVQRDRAGPGQDLLPGLRGRLRAVLRRARRWPRSGPAGPRPGNRSTCRRTRTAAASPRPCAACCRITW